MDSQPTSETLSPDTVYRQRGMLIDSDDSLPFASNEETLNTDNSWVLIYIDLMTLLLTMFVLMLAYAKTDVEKFRSASEAFAEQASRSATLVDLGANSRESVLSQQLSRRVAESGMLDNIEVLTQRDTVELRMKDNILFESGTAQLRQGGKTVLAKLIPLLKKDRHQITVEGHTDNIPIATERFPTNWELSAARASQVVRLLIAQGLPPQHTRAIGYADTRPIADNATPEGRSRNRRVSLIIELKQ